MRCIDQRSHGPRVRPIYLALVASLASCAADNTSPRALTATYSLASVDSRPAPTDLEDGWYLDRPALTRAVERRLDFRRADSVGYNGRIERLFRETDGSLTVESGFNFCVVAGYTRTASMVVLKYNFPSGGTRNPLVLCLERHAVSGGRRNQTGRTSASRWVAVWNPRLSVRS